MLAPPPAWATDMEGPLPCTIIEWPLPYTAMDCELQSGAKASMSGRLVDWRGAGWGNNILSRNANELKRGPLPCDFAALSEWDQPAACHAATRVCCITLQGSWHVINMCPLVASSLCVSIAG